MRPEPEAGVSAGANSVTYYYSNKQMRAARDMLSQKKCSEAIVFQVLERTLLTIMTIILSRCKSMLIILTVLSRMIGEIV